MVDGVNKKASDKELLIEKLEEIDISELSPTKVINKALGCLTLLHKFARRERVEQKEAIFDLPDEIQDTLADLLNACDWDSPMGRSVATAFHRNAIEVQNFLNSEIPTADI